jgi:hypothetical protein
MNALIFVVIFTSITMFLLHSLAKYQNKREEEKIQTKVDDLKASGYVGLEGAAKLLGDHYGYDKSHDVKPSFIGIDLYIDSLKESGQYNNFVESAKNWTQSDNPELRKFALKQILTEGLSILLKSLIQTHLVNHIDTLNTKYNQLITLDDYGVQDTSRWSKEVEYFIFNVAKLEIPKELDVDEKSYITSRLIKHVETTVSEAINNHCNKNQSA